jgi:drug/metabolite transporter (DMT)-like permease
MRILKTASLWTNKYFVAVMAVIACILWGSAFPVLKITYQELQIGTGDVSARMLIAGARFLLAGLILIVVQKFVFRKSVSIPSKGFMPLLLLGLAQTGLQYFFFYNGVANSTGIKSAILNSVGNLGVRTFFLDLTTRLGQDFVDILSGS